MFAARVIAFFYFLLSLTILAAAIPSSLTDNTIAAPAVARDESCTTGTIQCCQQVQSVRLRPSFTPHHSRP